MKFSSWLTIAFIVLKLTNQIDWSWWLVLSPMIIAEILYAIIVALLEKTETNQNRRVKKMLDALKGE